MAKHLTAESKVVSKLQYIHLHQNYTLKKRNDKLPNIFSVRIDLFKIDIMLIKI